MLSDSYHCVIRADSSEQSHHGASNDDGDLKSKSRDLHESDALSPLSASSASPPSAIGGGKKTSATALPFGLEARAHQTQNHSKNAFAIPVLNSAAAAPPRGRDESSSKSAAAKSSRSSGRCVAALSSFIAAICPLPFAISQCASLVGFRTLDSGDRKSGRVLPYSPTEAALLSSDPIRFTPAPSRRPPPATKVNAKEDEVCGVRENSSISATFLFSPQFVCIIGPC